LAGIETTESRVNAYAKICHFPRAPIMPVVGRGEVIACLLCKMIAGVFALTLVAVLGWGGFALFDQSKQPYAQATPADLTSATNQMEAVKQRVKIARQAINLTNYRLSNRTVLERLFAMTYPASNEFMLDKFSIRAFALVKQGVVVPGAPPALPTMVLAYTPELTWTVSTPTASEAVTALSGEAVQALRPDFGPGPTEPWSIKLNSNQQRSTQSGGREVYTVTVKGEILPPAGHLNLIKGASEDSRRQALINFLHAPKRSIPVPLLP
jgi:hypothetical protein